MSGTPGQPNTGRAIASLAKLPADTTRAGTQKMKFVPTLPIRRKKEYVRPLVIHTPIHRSSQSSREEPTAQATPAATTTTSTSSDRGGRAQGRGRGRGDASRGGRGAAPPRPPHVEMTASGPFAMGPSQAGSSAWGSGPRVSAMSGAPRGPPADAAALGANLTKTTAPTLKKERGERRVQVDEDAEVYSDPDEGVEIVDMRNVHAMDWMAPESLKWESPREKKKKKAAKVKKEEDGQAPVKGKGACASLLVREPSGTGC